MQSSTSTIIAIVVAGILIFIVPLATLTNRSDNVVQENVSLIVEEFVTEVRNTGKLSRAQYQEFVEKLEATGYTTYDIELQLKVLDENPGKKTAQANYTKIGENVYYVMYTTQVLKQLGIEVDGEEPSPNNVLILKEGDIIYLEVKNADSTPSQTLDSSLLGFSNAGEYAISASSSGMITVNGTNN